MLPSARARRVWAEKAAARAARSSSQPTPSEIRADGAPPARPVAKKNNVPTEAMLTQLVLTADPEALADLREQALAPLADVRPSTADKLADTLRAWLLHHGRREAVAESLFVHPQTVRYRMGQLRDLYGEKLDDPDFVLLLTVALGARSNREDGGAGAA